MDRDEARVAGGLPRLQARPSTAVIAVSMLVLGLGTGCSGHGSRASAYGLASCRISHAIYGAITWHRVPGESYRLSDHRWVAMGEGAESPVPGTYEIQIVPLFDDWGAIRINVVTGETWTAAKGRWVKNAVTAAESIPAGSAGPESGTSGASRDPSIRRRA